MTHAASPPAGRRRKRRRAASPRAAELRPADRPAAELRPADRPAAELRPADRPAAELRPADSPAGGEPGPEAGHAGISPTGRLARLLPYLIVICGTGLSLLTMRQGEQDVRSGTLELAGVLIAAAVARLALPERRAGLLASRRRLPDAAAFAALGIGLLVAGLFFPVPV